MKYPLLLFIHFYQILEPYRKLIIKNLFHIDVSCKYSPTCSKYFYQAVQKYGVIRGVFLGTKRILRCNPMSFGGQDPLL